MTREELNKEIRLHQECAMQLAQMLSAVDDEPEDQREGLLEDISFFSDYSGSMTMYLCNQTSRWPRLLAGVFGEGIKSVGSGGLDVHFKKAPLPLTVKNYLSPNCRIVKEDYTEEEPVMEATGETRTVTHTRTRVVCD